PEPSKPERDAASSERRTSKRTRSRKPQPAGEDGKEGKEAKEEKKVKKAKEEEGVKREAEGMGDAARRLGEALNAASPKLEAPSKRKGAGEDPFPAFPHPSEAETRLVHAALSQLHPQKAKGKIAPSSCGGRGRVLDSLVSTILSQNTTDTNSHRAYAALTERYASWEEVRTAPNEQVEETIRCGGLAATKTGGLLRPHPLSESVYTERGECSLEHLRDMGDAQVKAELRRFKGVGAKTISCVLLFCLGRADFPVDTHRMHAAVALGWVPKTADRDQTYEVSKRYHQRRWGWGN
ncbi:MAG: hypothetical protein SGPRY_013585, partial [Prymnesium sp.]